MRLRPASIDRACALFSAGVASCLLFSVGIEARSYAMTMRHLPKSSSVWACLAARQIWARAAPSRLAACANGSSARARSRSFSSPPSRASFSISRQNSSLPSPGISEALLRREALAWARCATGAELAAQSRYARHSAVASGAAPAAATARSKVRPTNSVDSEARSSRGCASLQHSAATRHRSASQRHQHRAFSSFSFSNFQATSGPRVARSCSAYNRQKSATLGKCSTPCWSMSTYSSGDLACASWAWRSRAVAIFQYCLLLS
mmetsp:Transcript_20253/g.57516  ORF Transcript_20253/g.57516 Transcript_20253/m.57516 type:complete len:263 (+) Transcript_20253:1380-2168(+)